MALQTVTLGDATTLTVPMRTAGAAFTPAAGYQLIFTAKLATSDLDAAAVIQKKSGGFGLTESTSSAVIALLPIDTSPLAGGVTLYCDIQAQSLTDAADIKTVAIFQLLTVRDVTRLTDTSITVYTSEPPGAAITVDTTTNLNGFLAGDGANVQLATTAQKLALPVSTAQAAADAVVLAAAIQRANHTGTQTLATISDAGTAAAAATGDFATAAQGTLADTSIQPSTVKVEGGGVVIIGTTDPTSGGANTGVDSVISGSTNHSNSGTHCSISGLSNHSNTGTRCIISGNNNYTNTGGHCSIVGSNNHTNTASYCSISGQYNNGNSGHYTSISGKSNHTNSGTHCQISGDQNRNNSGNYCSISGRSNHTNTGSYCSISGYYNNNNSGYYCQISGGGNANNTGSYIQISGESNFSNSGTHCQISGKYNYSNSGQNCQISGLVNNSNSGSYCSISGSYNSSNSGNYCSISGKYNSSNSGNYCSISGKSANSNNLDYARVHGGNTNARLIDLVAQINSSGTGATELLLGGTGGDRIIIPDQSAWSCEIHFVAKTATGAHASMQRVHGLLVRDGTATTWAAGVAETQVNIGTSNATFTVSADDTNEALKLAVTCSSGTVRAVATIKLTQVDY